MRATGLIVIATLIAALAAPASARPRPARPSPIAVTGAEVRASLGGSANSAAYMVIANSGPKPDRLVSVDCACAVQAEVHRSSMEGGVMSMAPAGPVEIPAHGRVVFAPGGLHVMLTGVKHPLIDGRRQAMTLSFERAGRIEAGFDVRTRIVSEGMAAMPGMR
jgi:copper(I)-binding protein